MNWLIMLPIPVGVLLCALLAMMVGISVYFTSYKVFGQNIEGGSADLAVNLFRVIATLTSLFLALTFADVRDDLSEIRASVQQEPAQLWNMNWELDQFGTDESREVQVLLTEYIDSVIESEWPALEEGAIDPSTVARFAALKAAIYALEPATPFQDRLQKQIIADVNAITTTRQSRIIRRGSGPIPVFLYIAIVGFIWTMALLSVFPPTRQASVVMTCYCFFFGTVIYIILSLEFFYGGLGEVSPETFRFLKQALGPDSGL